ncbi:hypothetical protein JOB18_043542 [Solea senegalensis]|uniref:Uncharacterized protein n=1 Tax=Solea senegalensis TaxID=28829 RepID=A0AAV6RDT2_SOLSE|nr:hypothetical protein JOB18_043542 [Solea senegalensis]
MSVETITGADKPSSLILAISSTHFICCRGTDTTTTSAMPQNRSATGSYTVIVNPGHGSATKQSNSCAMTWQFAPQEALTAHLKSPKKNTNVLIFPSWRSLTEAEREYGTMKDLWTPRLTHPENVSKCPVSPQENESTSV